MTRRSPFCWEREKCGRHRWKLIKRIRSESEGGVEGVLALFKCSRCKMRKSKFFV